MVPFIISCFRLFPDHTDQKLILGEFMPAVIGHQVPHCHRFINDLLQSWLCVLSLCIIDDLVYIILLQVVPHLTGNPVFTSQFLHELCTVGYRCINDLQSAHGLAVAGNHQTVHTPQTAVQFQMISEYFS